MYDARSVNMPYCRRLLSFVWLRSSTLLLFKLSIISLLPPNAVRDMPRNSLYRYIILRERLRRVQIAYGGSIVRIQR